MRINGEWYPCDDGFIRPTVVGRLRTGQGRLIAVRFLIDSGADWTTFAPGAVRRLRTTLEHSDFELYGIGGMCATSAITTSIQFACEDDIIATLHGNFGALTELGSLDMSVLGRDILNHFALILDRQHDLVVLINQRHRYSISFE
jgi:hypothetical protein